LWGLHRDGNIDRFLKPMFVWIVRSHMFESRFAGVSRFAGNMPTQYTGEIANRLGNACY